MLKNVNGRQFWFRLIFFISLFNVLSTGNVMATYTFDFGGVSQEGNPPEYCVSAYIDRVGGLYGTAEAVVKELNFSFERDDGYEYEVSVGNYTIGNKTGLMLGVFKEQNDVTKDMDIAFWGDEKAVLKQYAPDILFKSFTQNQELGFSENEVYYKDQDLYNGVDAYNFGKFSGTNIPVWDNNTSVGNVDIDLISAYFKRKALPDNLDSELQGNYVESVLCSFGTYDGTVNGDSVTGDLFIFANLPEDKNIVFYSGDLLGIYELNTSDGLPLVDTSSPVPVPSAVLLLTSGLGILGLCNRKKMK